MPLFMYRCPKTGYRVQGFVAEGTSVDDHVYEPVTCPVCKPDTSRQSAYRRPSALAHARPAPGGRDVLRGQFQHNTSDGLPPGE
jgi:hypothetical protein